MGRKRFRLVSIFLIITLLILSFVEYLPAVMAETATPNEFNDNLEIKEDNDENTIDSSDSSEKEENIVDLEIDSEESEDTDALEEEAIESFEEESLNQIDANDSEGEKITEKSDKIEKKRDLSETLDESYYVDFKNGNNGELKAEEGRMEVSYQSDLAKISTFGQTVIHDAAAPEIKNGVLEMDLEFTEDDTSRFGFVFRYKDIGNYAAVLKDQGNWVLHYKVDGQPTNQTITSLKDVDFNANEKYTVKLIYDEIYLNLFINGEEIININASNVPQHTGKIGVRSWFNNKTFMLESIENYSLDLGPGEGGEQGELIEIQSPDGEVTVSLDDAFPRIDHYTWKDNEIDGYKGNVNSIRVNNIRYTPAVEFEKLSENKAQYTIKVPDLMEEANLTIEATPEGVDIKVTDIKESSDKLVKTLEIPNLGLVSINNEDYDVAQQAAAWTTGEWHGVFEEYHDLHEDVESVTGGRTFAFLNTDTFAATILNNIVDSTDKIRINIDEDSEGKKITEMSNGAWTYHENNALDPEELPWAKIIFTGDNNGDDVIDWQDAAIAYRDVAETPVEDGYLLAPYKHELVRDHISYISFNIGSQAGMPFLRAFDNAKKISNLIDGFGQNILYKGYQAEGHDDSHPDFGGHTGIRQGGIEDFNYVLQEGKKHNIIGGVHINATEYMLDAFETNMDNMVQPLAKGWGWMDESYYVDQYKDLVSGELERRLNMLKEETGDNLSFVYIDVYSGADYKAKKLAEYVNNNGWMLGTEFAGPLFEQVAWTHWGTDPGYPNEGNDIKLLRFLRNHAMDGFMSHPLLKGNQQVGVGYWQNNPESRSFVKTQEVFFVHNLPTKYMQYFPITKWEDDRIEMENNVVVQREDNNEVHLYKDDHLVAIMSDTEDVSQSTVFIPWNPETEEKVYHWNPEGGRTTWTVPNSWDNATSAKLYELNDLNREFIQDVNINNGEVTLDVEEKTGYVLYLEEPEEQEDMDWGEGGLVKDPGFESHQFDDWEKSSTNENADHIQMVSDENLDGQLEVTSANDAKIEQVITGLTPGKTYTASVWVNIEDTRKVSIDVGQEGEEVTNWLEDTKHKFYSRQHKYLDKNFQQVKVKFDAVSETATLSLQVDKGEGRVLFDDVRIWENPGKTDTSGAVLFEDFENVDNGWGPFVYSRSGPNRTHFAEKNPEKDQIKHHVIDGRFSLKTNENGDPGEWLRTLPQTLRLEQNKTYTVKMDVNAAADDMYTVAVRTNEDGEVRDLASQTIKESDEEIEFTVTTDDAKDPYLAVIKNFNDTSLESAGILIIDNILVTDDDQIDMEQLKELIEEAQAISNEDGEYTEASFIALQDAIEVAEAALQTIETEEELTDAIAALQSAIDSLVEVEEGPESVNSTALEALVDAAKTLDSADYTETSYTALAEALDSALDVLADEEATQDDVDEATTALALAIAGLETIETSDPVVDKTVLTAIVAAAESLNSAHYTDESYANLVNALEAALVVLADEEAIQADVDEVTTALVLAIADLVVDCSEDPEEPGEDPKDSEDPKDDEDKDETPVVDEDGGSLPATATSIYNWLLVGFVFVLASGFILLVANRKKRSTE
ncbi:endo-alpha-N-acetylgalactosaminidase family protein [Amphibacillus sp. Q70]|uniref:endo-alpha-N-acetylgalactosaminidase family protein n=1 Tax=Amphibacillus sp. Q70 TaxID=3453416 RepID=UPI003F864495